MVAPRNTGDTGSGIDWNSIMSGIGNIAGPAAGLYGAGASANNSQNLINAGNAGFGMAGGAYNPSLFSGSGVGGTGFSVSSPTNGKPGSINSTLGAMNPMYGQYAGAAQNFLGQSQGLAGSAAGGAQGAYQSALASIMPQLQQMQGNLLSANNNALFQRGQLGSGSFGQNTAGGANNPINLTTQSLGSGFAQQDLNAITAAQNQGLNFFNSNLQGAGALSGMSQGATNTGLGMIGAQNALGQNPLAYSGLYGNQQIGATNAQSGMIGAVAGRNGVLGSNTGGYGSLASGLGGGMGPNAGAGGNPLGGIGQIINGVRGLFGGAGGGGGLDAYGSSPGSSNYLNVPGAGQGGNAGYMPDPYSSGNSFSPYVSSPDFGGGMTANQGMDPNNPFGYSFSGAGGQAATGQPNMMSGASNPTGGTLQGIGSQIGKAANMAGSALGVYNGIQKGGVSGTAGALLSGANLAKQAGVFTPSAGVGAALGTAGGLLGAYNGIKQGGVAGYGGAAAGLANAYAGASALSTSMGGSALAGAGALGAAAGMAGPVLAIAGGIAHTLDNGKTYLSGVGPGQSVMQLSNGQQGLRSGNMVLQVGQSGENPTAWVVDPSTGKQTQVPGNIGQVINSLRGLQPSVLSQLTYNPKANDTLIKSETAVPGGGPNMLGKTTGFRGMGINSVQGVSDYYSNAYTQLGGQGKLGVSFKDWLQQTANLGGNIGATQIPTSSASQMTKINDSLAAQLKNLGKPAAAPAPTTNWMGITAQKPATPTTGGGMLGGLTIGH